MNTTTLLFDVGGVVLTNGWDHAQRARAAAEFGFDAAAFEAAHAQRIEALETGALGFHDYLTETIFDQPRAFTVAELTEFIFSQSQPLPGTLELLAELAQAARLRLATLNNESRELNQHRIAWFGLRHYFSAFCSSCYLGARKPGAEIFRRGLGILQAEPAECLFMDDREENLAAPRSLGIATLRFLSAAQLRQELGQRGLL